MSIRYGKIVRFESKRGTMILYLNKSKKKIRVPQEALLYSNVELGDPVVITHKGDGSYTVDYDEQYAEGEGDAGETVADEPEAPAVPPKRERKRDVANELDRERGRGVPAEEVVQRQVPVDRRAEQEYEAEDAEEPNASQEVEKVTDKVVTKPLSYATIVGVFATVAMTLLFVYGLLSKDVMGSYLNNLNHLALLARGFSALVAIMGLVVLIQAFRKHLGFTGGILVIVFGALGFGFIKYSFLVSLGMLLAVICLVNQHARKTKN